MYRLLLIYMQWARSGIWGSSMAHGQNVCKAHGHNKSIHVVLHACERQHKRTWTKREPLDRWVSAPEKLPWEIIEPAARRANSFLRGKIYIDYMKAQMQTLWIHNSKTIRIVFAQWKPKCKPCWIHNSKQYGLCFHNESPNAALVDPQLGSIQVVGPQLRNIQDCGPTNFCWKSANRIVEPQEK